MSPGDSYESWPVIAGASNGDLVVIYGDGTSHTTPTVGRSVKARISSDGGATWGSEVTVINTASDDACFGAGVDSAGDLLAWVRHVTGAGVFSHKLYVSTDDGATWSERSAPTLSPKPVVVGPIIAVPTVGLMCWWHAGTESGEGSRSYGTLTSADDGSTWTQTTIATGVADATWPVEGRLLHLHDGVILGIGRTQVTGGALFQMQSDDYGASWSATATNITDQHITPTALLLDGSEIHAYYFHRGQGILRHRVTDEATVWDNPTAWPGGDVVLDGASFLVSDAGYPHALLDGGTHRVVYYDSFDGTRTQIRMVSI